MPAVPFEVDNFTLRKWQEIANTLSDLANVPAGLIMRVTWPKIEVLVSSESEGNPYTPGASEHLPDSGLYCETVIKTKDKLKVPNATADDDWKDNPDIELDMISYLGLPIALPDGKIFGTICILDSQPNGYTEKIEKMMLQLRELIESHLALIWKNHELQIRIAEIEELRGIIPICSFCKNIRNDSGYWEAVDQYMRDHRGFDFTHSICPKCLDRHYGDLEE